jgi:hypothetical protein
LSHAKAAKDAKAREAAIPLGDLGGLRVRPHRRRRRILSHAKPRRRRRADADFDKAVTAARAAAATRLGGAAGNRPPEAWRMRGGVELVVTRRGQIARAPGERRWTKRTEERFLVALRKTRNLSVAAPAAGMSIASLEKHRARWPAFDRRVRAALRLSYGPVAMRLIEGERLAGEAPDEVGGWAWQTMEMPLETLLRTARRNKGLINGDG